MDASQLSAGAWKIARFAAQCAAVAGIALTTGRRQSDGGSVGHREPTWNGDRLRRLVADLLQTQQIIVVSNREPVIHQQVAGRIVVQRPASGLVTALEPVVRTCGGVWVAHGSGSADREVVDRLDRLRVDDKDGSYVLRRVWLTPEQERGYYYGFANQALWPLCHRAHAQPIFRRDHWAEYVRVNRRFAEAVVDESASDDPIVLVQDYHFALVPRLLRQRLPRATIIAFWHIPWPNAERFAICPYQRELLEGLLGSTIVGCQTVEHCSNFLQSVARGLEARIDRDDRAVEFDRQTTLARPYPISIEWPNPWADSARPVDVCRETVRRTLGVPSHAKLVVSVDRMDYTKGIEERLLAFERLLEGWPQSGAPLVFLQVAAPSRTEIQRYSEFAERVDRLVDAVNARFSTLGYTPVVLLHRHCGPQEVFEYYRSADVCYISSLHDGMNLVAKEFVAARDDVRGVLVLSRFAGAARELTEALIVNPYDIDGAAEALQRALSMPLAEQQERMHALRAVVETANVFTWAGAMLTDAALSHERQARLTRLNADSHVVAGDGSGDRVANRL